MKKIPSYILFVLVFSSLLLAYLFSLLNQARSYTIANHSYHFKIFSFLMAAAFAFVVLWIALFLHSKFLARLFEIDPVRTRNLDIWSYSPLFLIMLLPLANSRYVDSHDFSERVSLF